MSRQMLKYFFILVFLTSSICCFSNDTRAINDVWNKVNVAEEKNDLKEATIYYKQLNSLYDSLYNEINSTQVVDLRRTYFIGDLELERQQQQADVLRYIYLFLLLTILFSVIGYLSLRWQKVRLLHTRMELEEAKRKAEQSIYNKSVYLSNMSHEIRTPLNALTGFSAILSEPTVDSEMRNQCNNIIQFNAGLLLNLINDVVDISCMDTERMSFQMKSCDVVALCRNVIKTLDGIKHTQAEITFVTSFESLVIETDEMRLQQMLINLLVNATKFTPEGVITLELNRSDSGTLLFTVTDTGCGIPAELQKKVFDRFETATHHNGSAGIGLSLCKIIINRLHGDIWIDSSYTNGTRFIFTHPVCQ